MTIGRMEAHAMAMDIRAESASVKRLFIMRFIRFSFFLTDSVKKIT